MTQHDYAVIMAGGGGTRLWPLSRQARPKQMLRLGSERTLFQMAMDRLEGLFPPERILIVTVADQAAELQRQVPQIPRENYLLEPMPRGTASVVGLAAVTLHQRDAQARMVVLTADHFIQNVAAFQSLLGSALQLAEQDYLVTLGISPTYPATGYGYVQRGKMLGAVGNYTAFEVLRFKEKPDEASAQAMIAGGDHDWNSGMFIWRVARILDELKQHMPALYAQLQTLQAAIQTPAYDRVVHEVWPTILPQTIDYGIMEKASRIAILPARDLGWNDVGSWDSLFEVLPADENGNIILGAQHVGLDSGQDLICSETSDRLIVTIGVQGMIIVDTGDALLVCPKDDAQKVRQLVNLLKEKGYARYL